ncbi:glycoside hydrolase family 127 protein [Cellulomonas shaoxiangyii]|uniref:Glycoside hydrolase family 127 protein n=1 Tax=Cellulomonas shaoxiangyii TaxID=2566013 RepID=A0A4P7SJV3_9CELL|nr:beta-L-arabinofuranosidase domain-containing protein [Cellulomonas shaoxiangyii]QCB94410.1 glycoside hydrolase family 127 protein [Cellulomonas shaoxiangyii]TGY80169.1 glycoside hydrolase family 127 protein [Cellulomonas shaoxiangyii]
MPPSESHDLRVAPHQHGRPAVPSRSRWRPLGLDEVTLTGGFWGDLQDLNASTMIAHVEGWLERLGWNGNFDAAVEGRLPLDRQGREFSDSETYKLLEAMAWEVGRTGDADLDRRLRALTARVAAAQEPDGYLSTMFGRPGQRPRWSDLEWGHELYCIGHLVQAGVARARTHGDDELVQVAVRAADLVCREFGADGPQQGVCGHPEIEVALVELYRVTGEQRYLDQARLFVERRGHGLLGEIDFGPQYFQDDLPVRDAHVLDGHAVRALYLASGAADLAVEDGDDELLAAVTAQVLTTLARRTYLTGGMGAHHEGESFGADFELPPDRSYSETCAGIASVMVNQRLLLQTGDARHADAVERTLYNVVAASPSQDGRAFYYTNTLHQRVPGREVAPDELSPRAASSLRAPFFAVSCCPTNVTRTVASLAAYVATVDDHGLQLHQYAPATIRAELADGRAVELEVTTSYPDDGRVVVRTVRGPEDGWTLTLRVPAWAEDARVTRADGTTAQAAPGYVEVAGPAQGEQLVLDLPVRARWTWADPRVDAVRGQVAVERGPLVLALESTDLGDDVASAVVSTAQAPVERDGRVLVPVASRELPDGPWPFRGAPAGAPDPAREVPLVPYHAWANRGPSTMRVWLPVE